MTTKKAHGNILTAKELAEIKGKFLDGISVGQSKVYFEALVNDAMHVVVDRHVNDLIDNIFLVAGERYKNQLAAYRNDAPSDALDKIAVNIANAWKGDYNTETRIRQAIVEKVTTAIVASSSSSIMAEVAGDVGKIKERIATSVATSIGQLSAQEIERCLGDLLTKRLLLNMEDLEDIRNRQQSMARNAEMRLRLLEGKAGINTLWENDLNNIPVPHR